MAKLQLSIYQFVLKERGKRAGEEYQQLGVFYRENFVRDEDDLQTVTRDKIYLNFIEDFINLFDNEFRLNPNETKGIGIHKIHPYPSSYIIDGIIKGGPTGIEQEIFNVDDMVNPEGLIEEDKLTTLPYYFKLWAPYDSQTGILMIQSYTDYGVNNLIIGHIREVFRKYNTTMVYERFIPTEIKEQYIADSSVYKIAFLKNTLSRSARERLNPAFTDSEGLEVRIEIKGFNNDPDNFLHSLFTPEHIIGSNLSDLEMNNNDDYKTIIYYKDDQNHKAHASAEKHVEITPTIYLPESLKETSKDYIDYEKGRVYTNGMLDKIKTEINYTPSE